MSANIFSPGDHLSQLYSALLNARMVNPNSLECMLAHARMLVARGYEVVPILEGEKYPRFDGWNSDEPTTIERVEQQVRDNYDPFCGRDYAKGHRGFGFLTRRLPSVDIDTPDIKLTHAIATVVENQICPTPMLRCGSKGVMMSFRLADGETKASFTKLIIKKQKTDKDDEPATYVELFGDRVQFAGIGIHPRTGLPYRWINPDWHPLLNNQSDLPVATSEQMRGLVAPIIEKLRELGHPACLHDATKPVALEPKIHVVKSAATTDAPVTATSTKESNYKINVTELFENMWAGFRTKTSRTGYRNIEVCPGCGSPKQEHKWKFGLKVYEDGGAGLQCFRSGCEYNDAVGWYPGTFPGRKLKHLYELLGGDKADFIYDPYKRFQADIDDMKEWMKTIKVNKRDSNEH